MPLYEYRCRSCGDTFERLRPSREADGATTCSAGHDDTVRLLSLVARPTTGAAAVSTGETTASPASGGGCCGGGCCSA